jgi:hypothetical protein
MANISISRAKEIVDANLKEKQTEINNLFQGISEKIFRDVMEESDATAIELITGDWHAISNMITLNLQFQYIDQDMKMTFRMNREQSTKSTN